MRLGSRRSALALAQAELVAEMLGDCEIVPITTRGDRGAPAADKSRWVGELEQALSDGEIDLAVHSAKDLPGDLSDGLALLGVPPRAPSEDVLCGAGALAELEPGARVGTSSIRRMAQLRAAREDLDVVALRGNVDTRLTRLAEPERELRAIVLARAGLARLGRERELGGVLDPAQFVPAPGQGAIALEGRAQDPGARAAAESITDAVSFACLRAERTLAQALGASCHTPMGALAEVLGDGSMRLRGWVGLPDGSAWVGDERDGELVAPEELARAVAARMGAAGARELLGRAEEMAGVGGE
ncbi:MAG TPA: hydroxymethylbilane synthase [Solirubrobacteraceae bacterium]|jgi:hydroxymethylbilane synthase